jgi:hypothetical protein
MITLGDLIDTLEQLNPELGVRFDSGELIAGFESWRGDYSELSLAPHSHREALSPIDTVGDLLAEARKADGQTFRGYKGGDFVMGRHTRVWADPYGRADGRTVEGVRIVDGWCEIVSHHIDPYRGDQT